MYNYNHSKYKYKYNCKYLYIKLETLINVIRKDPKVSVKINDILDRYMRLPYNYRSRIGYDCLIQNVILKELINIMGTTIVELDIELKMKISRIKYLENKTHI